MARVTPAAPLAVPAFGSTYTYDSRGNRTQRNVTPGTPDIPAGLTSYVYDENRLTTETPPLPAASIAYGHNANGNRTSRIQASTTENIGPQSQEGNGFVMKSSAFQSSGSGPRPI